MGNDQIQPTIRHVRLETLWTCRRKCRWMEHRGEVRTGDGEPTILKQVRELRSGEMRSVSGHSGRQGGNGNCSVLILLFISSGPFT